MKRVMRSYKDRQWVRVNFTDCGNVLMRSVAVHHQTRQGIQAKSESRPYPVGGCSGWVVTRTAMRMHF